MDLLDALVGSLLASLFAAQGLGVQELVGVLELVKILSAVVRSARRPPYLIFFVILDFWVFVVQPFGVLGHVLARYLLSQFPAILGRLRHLHVVPGRPRQCSDGSHLDEMCLGLVVVATEVLLGILIGVSLVF